MLVNSSRIFVVLQALTCMLRAVIELQTAYENTTANYSTGDYSKSRQISEQIIRRTFPLYPKYAVQATGPAGIFHTH